jgi:catechol 2,3-dioxygenase-like lactoylglutathione lyase family enzyme
MTAFYRDMLGFPVKFELKLPDGRVFGRYFELGGTSFLEIFDHAGASEMWGGVEGPVSRRPDGTYQHFCLEIDGLETYCASLVGRGLAVTEITTGIDFSRQAWVKDPDGNDIELMEYTNRSLQLADAK